MLDETQKPLPPPEIPRKTSAEIRKTQTQIVSSRETKGFIRTTAEHSGAITGGIEKFLWSLAGMFSTPIFLGVAHGWEFWLCVAGSLFSSLLAIVFGLVKHLLPQSPMVARIQSVRKNDGK